MSWTGRIVPSNASGPDRRPGHRHAWWPHLRAAGGDSFVPSDGSPAEDFIFYDGVQQFTSPFRFRMSEGHDRVLARSNETRVFISRGGQLYKHEANRDGTGAVMQLGPLGTRIEPALRSELRALGLTEGETHSLLRTWHDELHRTDVARAFYLISRERYDRMLPLRITPAPTRTVRAGLVIETL